jgi:hypothetical protein
MTSDLERRIQQLCSQVVATNDSEELDRLCRELQEALKEHIASLRSQVKQYDDDTRRRNPKKGE